MSDAEPQFTPRSRNWFRFSLRTLLIAITVCCVVLGYWMNQLIRQRIAVRHFYELTAKGKNGGQPNWITMGYRYEGKVYSKPQSHKWLHSLIGEEAFGRVTLVQLLDTQTADDDLRFLADVPTVEWVKIDNTNVTDKGLRHLLACPKLRVLELAGLPITDDGVAKLAEMRQLEEISLCQTKITDASLEHLAKMSNLREVLLCDTAITDAGYQRLKAALPACKIRRRLED
jgi:hypothetical protein